MTSQRRGWVVAAAPPSLERELAERFDGSIWSPPTLRVVRIDRDVRHAPNLVALLRDENGRDVVRLERKGELPELFARAHKGPVKAGHVVQVDSSAGRK